MIELQSETPEQYAQRMTARDDCHFFQVEIAEKCIRHFPGDVEKAWLAYREFTKSNFQLKSFISQCFLTWRADSAKWRIEFFPR
jgi:hypothetical protein